MSNKYTKKFIEKISFKDLIFRFLIELDKEKYSSILLKKKGNGEIINVNTIILFAGIIYFVDANLNFPHARPVMQVPFILILVLSFIKNNKKLKHG